MEETEQPFEVALAATRAGNLFTTHTAVAAGFDRFSPALIEQYLGWCMQKRSSGIALQDLLAMGRQNPGDSSRVSTWRIWQSSSGAVNGVSRLHTQVSEPLSALFPRWPEGEVLLDM